MPPKEIKVEVVEDRGLTGFLRFNQLFPSFDNPAIRRVALHAVNQKDFMDAVVGGNAPYQTCGLFPPTSDMYNDAGMASLSDKASLDDLKRELAASGYKGERVVFLSPTDVPRINAIASLGVDMLRKIGMNVDEISTDWGTTVQRSVSRQPLDKGGWNMFAAFTGGIDTSTPAATS